jgi:coenzyme F420-reducing hydrogenase delta subunit
MYWCSSAESEKLVKSVEDAFEKIQRLGPNPISIPSLETSKEEVSTTP